MPKPEASPQTQPLSHRSIRLSFYDDSELLSKRDAFLSLHRRFTAEDTLMFDTLLQLAYVCGQVKSIAGIRGES